AQRRRGVLGEDLLVHPTGALTALRSGGGDQKHQPRLAGVRLEAVPEVVDAADVLERPGAGRRRPGTVEQPADLLAADVGQRRRPSAPPPKLKTAPRFIGPS